LRTDAIPTDASPRRRAIGVLVAALVFSGGFAIRLHRIGRVGSRSESWWQPRPSLRPDFHFTEVSDALGVRFIYRDPQLVPTLAGRERLLFWGSGAAVADVDGDGYMDLLFVAAQRGDPNHLYINQKGHGFVERAAAWGIADNDPDSAHTAAAFFDYDNDGRPDVFLAGLRCTQLLHNTGTRFEDVTREAGVRDCDNSIAAVPLDADGDGRLDLYLMRYWNNADLLHDNRSRVWPENVVNALNGGRNTLFRNLGDGHFRDVTASTGGGDTHWTLDGAWGDLRNTNETSLYLANDFGADVLYDVRGASLIEEFARGLGDRRFGMGVSLGDLDGDGTPHVLVTNEFVDGYNQTGNFLWRFGRARYTMPDDQAGARGVDDCGWAWGSAFVDFDLDGRQDLYVANGFISGEEKQKDLLHHFYAELRSDYAFTAGTLMSSPGYVLSDVKNWPLPRHFNYAGHQNDCLFWNRGERLYDVAGEVGLVEDADGRAVVPIDWDNDGAVDLVVTTQNGRPHVYHNDITPGGRFIGFSLVGRRANRDGAGARIEVRQAERTFYRWATGGHTGFLASSDPRLHVGLPRAGTVDARVRWPSGTVDELRGLASGRYYRVVEGRGVQ
jgi:hypothetical protein